MAPAISCRRSQVGAVFSVARQPQIIVLRGGALGDFILTLPALAALRTGFPESELALVAEPAWRGLALKHCGVDLFFSLEDRALTGFFSAAGPLDDGWTRRFAGARCIISYLADAPEIFHRRLASTTCARIVRGPHKPDDALARHAAEQLMQPVLALGLKGGGGGPALGGLRRRSLSKEILAIHPGSGSQRKNWPEERWGEWLESWVVPAGWKILMIEGEAERGRAERLAGRLPAGRVEIAAGLPLDQLVERLSWATGFVGHDSGVTHLAVAAGLPVLTLWGPTNATVWSPQGERARRCEARAGLEKLTVAEVGAAVADLWPRWRALA